VPLDAAKEATGMEATEGRLSWHSLRYAFASALATEIEVAATTLARVAGHTDPAFTLKLYAKDARNDATLGADVLKRAAHAGVAR
jgi:integrase